jgi:hypothetical protein
MKGAPAKFLSPKLLRNPFDSIVAHFLALFRRHLSRRGPSLAMVDTAPLRASTSCPTSRRLLDAREAISSSFSVTFSRVVMAGRVL